MKEGNTLVGLSARNNALKGQQAHSPGQSEATPWESYWNNK